MFKSLSALVFATVAGAGMVAVSSSADAHPHHCCGPLPTVHTSSVVYKVSHVTRYHDTYRRHYFNQDQYFIHTTRVQPIVYVNNVLRVHHVEVGVWHPIHVSNYETLPTQYISSSSVVNINDGCICCKPHY